MRTSRTARRPDWTLEDSIKKEIRLIDMACPYEFNKDGIREEKIRKYKQLCYKLRERRDGYKVKGNIPLVIGCFGGEMKQLKKDIRGMFDDEKDLHRICREMQKTVLRKSETIMRKIISGLLTEGVFC